MRARPGEHSDHHRPERVADRLPDPSGGEARARDDARSLATESTQLGGDLVDAPRSEHDERVAVLAGHARKIGARRSPHRQARWRYGSADRATALRLALPN